MHTAGWRLLPVHADTPAVRSPHTVICSRTGVPVLAPGIDKDPRTSGPSVLDEAADGHTLCIVVAVITGVVQEQADTVGLRGPHAKPARNVGVLSFQVNETTPPPERGRLDKGSTQVHIKAHRFKGLIE